MRGLRVAMVLVTLVVASTAAPAAGDELPAMGELRPAGSLAEERVHHTATTLRDGRVLVVGGVGDDEAVRWADDIRATGEAWSPAEG